MAFYSAQMEFGPFASFSKPAALSVDANGGTVKIEVLHDPDTSTWIEDQTISADSVLVLEVANLTKLRLTPAGGATYNFAHAQ